MMIKYVAVVLLGASSAGFCGAGVVTDSLGVPLSGVKLIRHLDSAVAVTDDSGRWAFKEPSTAIQAGIDLRNRQTRMEITDGRILYRPGYGRNALGRQVASAERGLELLSKSTAPRALAAASAVSAVANGWTTLSAEYDSKSTSNRIVMKMIGSKGMVAIPGGFDSLGSKSQAGNPPHVARVAGFWMDTVEVTQALYDSLMGFNPSLHASCTTCPVERVTWYDAVRFCNARSRAEGLPEVYDISKPDSILWTWDPSSPGFRLPTDQEWEYAARAGASTDWYWGTMIGVGTVPKYAWYDLSSGDSTHPVGKLLPNAFGLRDISGNVGEWTNDWLVDYTRDTLTYYKGPSTMQTWKVVRGGNYANQNTGIIITQKAPSLPDNRWHATGFRCARGVMP